MKTSVSRPGSSGVPESGSQRLLFLFFLISGILILLLPIEALLEEVGLWPWEENQTFVVIVLFAIAGLALWLLQLFPVLLVILVNYRKNLELSLPLILLLLTLGSLFAGMYVESKTPLDKENFLLDILDYAGMFLFVAYAVTAVIVGIRGLKKHHT